jgi:probable F420-dependent oxidoreductase
VNIGVSLPSVGPIAEREFVLETARAADRLGLHSVWGTDHVVIPKDRTTEYPYKRSTTEIFFTPGITWLDPVATMGVVAGATENVLIGSAVLVLPYRNPVVLANEMSTLDRLSEGRMILGIGAGWLAEEFRAIGVPPDERGSRASEYIRAMKTLWRSPSPVSFEGKHVRFDDVVLATQPYREGGPPVYVGGNTTPAARRAGALADGWLGMELWVEEIAEFREIIARAAKEAGRDPSDVALALRRGLRPPFEISDFLPERRSFSGSAGEVADELLRYRDEGLSTIILDLAMLPAEAVRTMEWLAGEVKPLLA